LHCKITAAYLKRKVRNTFKSPNVAIARLASRKGFVLTAAIAAGIVGASFLIWFIPQNNSSIAGTTIAGYDKILADTYSQHTTLAVAMAYKFNQWKSGNLSSAQITEDISAAKFQVKDMSQRLAQANPTAEWKKSFVNYSKSLDSFAAYLDAMQKKVQSDDKSAPDVEMNRLKQESDGFVDELEKKS